jgi:hypothetical protein
MTRRTDYKLMTPIDLKILGSSPYSEMDARATIGPEHAGFIEIIIPIFEQDAIRVLKELELKRELLWSKGSGYEPLKKTP